MMASIRKDDGATAIQHHAVIKVMTQRAGQNATLNIAALAHEIIRRMAMGDALDIPHNARTFIAIRRDIVSGCANELHAATMRLRIGVGALEARQEGVMDIDAAACKLGTQAIRQDLHVTREHDDIGLG